MIARSTRLSKWGATPDTWLTDSMLETIETVCAEIAKFRDFSPELFFIRCRGDQRIAEARQLAMAVIRAGTGLSLEAIGRIFVGRNHGTVIHACKKVTKRREADPILNFVFLSLVTPGKLPPSKF